MRQFHYIALVREILHSILYKLIFQRIKILSPFIEFNSYTLFYAVQQFIFILGVNFSNFIKFAVKYYYKVIKLNFNHLRLLF